MCALLCIILKSAACHLWYGCCRNPPIIIWPVSGTHHACFGLLQEPTAHIAEAGGLQPSCACIPPQCDGSGPGDNFSTVVHLHYSAHPTEHIRLSTSDCAPLLEHVQMSPSSSLFLGHTKLQKLVMFEMVIWHQRPRRAPWCALHDPYKGWQSLAWQHPTAALFLAKLSF